MTRTTTAIAILIVLSSPIAGRADTIHVPADFTLIHDAVQAAAPGDIVEVAAGTYADCTHETEGPGSTPACVIMQPGVTLRGAGSDVTIIDAGDLGRGIFLADADGAVIENLQVTGAYAEIFGAGILVRQGSTGVRITGVEVQGCGDGGIIVIDGSEAEISDARLLGNIAKQGGGLAIEETSSATVTGCLIDGNTAPSGAGVFVRAGSTLAMTACTISNNAISSDSGRGGGVCVQEAHAEISSCDITGNSTRGTGGGMIFISGATGTVSDCEISGNTTEGSYNYGAGISVQSSAVTLRGLLIAGNAAESPGSNGGGIDIQFNPAPTVESCTIVGNSCSAGATAGGILVQWNATPTFTNCLITDSTAGAGIAGSFSSSWTAFRCNLWDNAGGDAIDGIDGGCNLSVDPLYCDAAAGNYRLSPSSPCAAGNHPAGGDCEAFDIGAFPAGCGVGVEDLPSAVRFLGNAPNPFNPQTTISFVLDEPGDAVVRIFDLRGRALRTFRRTDLSAGQRHEITWNGRDDDGRELASGVYLYRLETGDVSATKRMSLIR